MKKKYLMLSADSDVSLYKVDYHIVDRLKNYIINFYKWKSTNCFTHELFVNYLKERFGEESIIFIKVVDNPEDDEWKDIIWFNF